MDVIAPLHFLITTPLPLSTHWNTIWVFASISTSQIAIIFYLKQMLLLLTLKDLLFLHCKEHAQQEGAEEANASTCFQSFPPGKKVWIIQIPGVH